MLGPKLAVKNGKVEEVGGGFGSGVVENAYATIDTDAFQEIDEAVGYAEYLAGLEKAESEAYE